MRHSTFLKIYQAQINLNSLKHAISQASESVKHLGVDKTIKTLFSS